LYLTGKAVRSKLAVKGICRIAAGDIRACPTGKIDVIQDGAEHLSVLGLPNGVDGRTQERLALDAAEYLAAKAQDIEDWRIA